MPTRTTARTKTPRINSPCIAPDRMTLTQAGRRLGVSRFVVRRLVEEGLITRLPMARGIQAALLVSSVEELAAKMFGPDRATG
jgi:hypothetical protein